MAQPIVYLLEEILLSHHPSMNTRPCVISSELDPLGKSQRIIKETQLGGNRGRSLIIYHFVITDALTIPQSHPTSLHILLWLKIVGIHGQRC